MSSTAITTDTADAADTATVRDIAVTRARRERRVPTTRLANNNSKDAASGH